jgi:DNA adenine methylase
MKIVSPLRYPGGKAKFLDRFTRLIQENRLHGTAYNEPYAGGAGLAIRLLTLGFVREIHLNDVDSGVASFWQYALHDTERFCEHIAAARLSVAEWRKQRDIYLNLRDTRSFELGFATFYLNRTSRSGIIIGSAPIGGYDQRSRWKIDARFNRKALIENLRLLAQYASKIRLTELDAIDFIRATAEDDLLYADPPYYEKGNRLYRDFYTHADHVAVAREIENCPTNRWVVSYDTAPEIFGIYQLHEPTFVDIQYSVANVRTAKEVLFVGPGLTVPSSWTSDAKPLGKAA